ncbi:MAG: D-alanine--D-alanine ligase [Solirubrobacteraceae bacterium]
MNMIKVAVIMGGYSQEADISLKSGKLVLDNLNKNIYEAYEVHILNEGWYCLIGNEKYLINKGEFNFTLNNQEINFDVIYNTIHGTPGEDGYLQAYFEVIGIKYTGCPFYQSALTFNKKDCISVLNKYGIKSAKSVYLRKGEIINETNILNVVGLPCFVKPNKSGSSLGASKVNLQSELNKAIDIAFEQDSEILIEEFSVGTEVSVGVLNYKNETIVLGITEIISENEFFDYEAKYHGKVEEITPARLNDEVRKKVENVAIKAYLSLNMKGFSRSEYIIMNNEPYFIEMNTLPGLSPQSIFPQQAKAANINIGDLFENEIKTALKQHLK